MLLLPFAIASILALMGLFTPLSLTLLPISWVQTLGSASPTLHTIASGIATEVIRTRRDIGLFIAGVHMDAVRLPHAVVTSSSASVSHPLGSPPATYPWSNPQVPDVLRPFNNATTETPQYVALSSAIPVLSDMLAKAAGLCNHLITISLSHETRTRLRVFLPVMTAFESSVDLLGAHLRATSFSLDIPAAGTIQLALHHVLLSAFGAALLFRHLSKYDANDHTQFQKADGSSHAVPENDCAVREGIAYKSESFSISVIHDGELTGQLSNPRIILDFPQNGLKLQLASLPDFHAPNDLSLSSLTFGNVHGPVASSHHLPGLRMISSSPSDAGNVDGDVSSSVTAALSSPLPAHAPLSASENSCDARPVSDDHSMTHIPEETSSVLPVDALSSTSTISADQFSARISQPAGGLNEADVSSRTPIAPVADAIAPSAPPSMPSGQSCGNTAPRRASNGPTSNPAPADVKTGLDMETTTSTSTDATSTSSPEYGLHAAATADTSSNAAASYSVPGNGYDIEDNPDWQKLQYGLARKMTEPEAESILCRLFGTFEEPKEEEYVLDKDVRFYDYLKTEKDKLEVKFACLRKKLDSRQRTLLLHDWNRRRLVARAKADVEKTGLDGMEHYLWTVNGGLESSRWAH
ncbi:hypothetical protein OBBRIDRAFT_661791 [Obba rivulosa]|uniref:Uncharacterized protein n=1 Tax=Obba rivulosa TaxID=1052685 RepID=A0A8E2B1I9_9APHY|nr:hypothetical protein OBBRIDRAFT_661791 [Obba rivulosa]